MTNVGAVMALSILLLLPACHLVLPLSSGPSTDAPPAADIPPAADLPEVGVVDVVDAGDTDAPACTTLVQTGEVQPRGSKTIPVPGIKPGCSFIVCSFRTNGSEPYNAGTCQLEGNDLVIATGNAAAEAFVRYHLVQLAGASVQRGHVLLGKMELGQTLSLQDAVDRDRTFVLVTTRADVISAGKDQQRLVLARLDSPTSLALERGESGVAVDVEWQVVQLGRATVESRTTAIPSGDSSAQASITPVEINRTFVVFSSKAGSEAGGDEEVYGVRGRLEDSQHLVFERGVFGAQIDVHWFVVQLPPGNRVFRSYADFAPTSLTASGWVPSVELNRALPLSSSYIKGSGSSLFDALSLTVRLLDTNTVELERGDNDELPLSYSWSVVELAP